MLVVNTNVIAFTVTELNMVDISPIRYPTLGPSLHPHEAEMTHGHIMCTHTVMYYIYTAVHSVNVQHRKIRVQQGRSTKIKTGQAIDDVTQTRGGG